MYGIHVSGDNSNSDIVNENKAPEGLSFWRWSKCKCISAKFRWRFKVTSSLKAATLLASSSLIAAMAVHAEPFAYVTNQASEDKVWVIDTATNTVVDTVTVADIPARVAISPDGAFAYVTIVVNEDSMQQSGSILKSSVLSSPVFFGSAFPEANFASSFFSNKVAVIDTATNNVVNTVTTVEPAPFGIAITPDGAFVYVAHLNSNVSVIDAATNTVTTTIPVGDGADAADVAITPDGAFVYVTTSNADIVSVIDTATNTVALTIPVGDTPSGIAITPDGAFAYVTNLGSNSVSLVSIATNAVVATLQVNDAPGGIAISADGAFAYVTNQRSDDVSVIDTQTNTVVATIPVGDTPIDVATTPDSAFAYVTNIFSADVSVIDAATNTVADTVPVGFLPEGIAITPSVEPPVINAAIDVRPFSRKNRIQPRSRGFVQVAILGSQEFDALQVDIPSVRFGPSGATAKGSFSRAADTNRDGFTDMILLLGIRGSGIQCGDTEATLTGELLSGEPITGTDTINTLPCH